MRTIHDLQAVTKSVLNRVLPIHVRKQILKRYGIAFIETTKDGHLRFQCRNTDPRWFGKILVAKPMNDIKA